MEISLGCWLLGGYPWIILCSTSILCSILVNLISLLFLLLLGMHFLFMCLLHFHPNKFNQSSINFFLWEKKFD